MTKNTSHPRNEPLDLRRARFLASAAAVAALLLSACQEAGVAPAVTWKPATHPFLIAAAPHKTDCNTCHGDFATFTQFTCIGCHAHEQGLTDRLHPSSTAAGYAYAAMSCRSCHPDGSRHAFDHVGIVGDCASCHDVAAPFAAFPTSTLAGAPFVHPPTNGNDCSACHGTTGWSNGRPSGLVSDVARSVALTGLVPTWTGAAIGALTPVLQRLPMPMSHATAQVAPSSLGTCSTCHAGAGTGALYPGTFHASLASHALPQPGACSECHASSSPIGFVGPTSTQPARLPASGEMRHDAILWSGGARTAAPAVTADCGVCHAAPTSTGPALWALSRAGSAPATYHAALGLAALGQPGSCIDCHANTRPAASIAVSAQGLPSGLVFDHASQAAQGDCLSCHDGAVSGWTLWSGGRVHHAGDPAPASCLPCHEGERPTATGGWLTPPSAGRPFDAIPNGKFGHGAGLDCALCHAGPGTGAWGGSQNWAGGSFTHASTTIAGSTCIACHTTQRPDLVLGSPAAAQLGFDHATNGSGDCFGCHQATVLRGVFQSYFSATGSLPGGDWRGGRDYPGSNLVGSSKQYVTVATLSLVRATPGGWITGLVAGSSTLLNQMLHVSRVFDAGPLSPLKSGPDDQPVRTSCWHCHVNSPANKGVVATYAEGQFHASVDNYQATTSSLVTGLPQPTAICLDCHAPMRPPGIVGASSTSLSPMDHVALFTAPALVGGVSATSVAGIECALCHAQPGVRWTDGRFHANLGAAVPQDCAQCHYPLLLAASADAASGTAFTMKHRSSQVATQACQGCHGAALAASTASPPAATAWRPGLLHKTASPQPTACLDCHAVSAPAGAPTQSSVVYPLPLGATASNGGQWLSHAAPDVLGKECAVCHASDAKAAGATWSKGTSFHAQVPSPAGCQGCHGTTNGGGSVAGTNNNLPVGLTNSTTLTTASADATTGVAQGTFAQISHADGNVTGHDCGFCHTQAGVSTAAGVQGKEWAQATFHVRFGGAAPLVMNGTTGRCSTCHLNVKPGASFGTSHAAFTSAPGTQDCASCHTWPGTGTAAAPNWLGAVGGAPGTITVGGFTIPAGAAGSAVQQPTASLSHPVVGTQACSACHAGGVGGKAAIGYDHKSGGTCNSCHEAGSNLLSPVWSGVAAQASGAGDTRPYTLAPLTPSLCRTAIASPGPHFYPSDCSLCHKAPAGTVTTKTGAAYTTVWKGSHPPKVGRTSAAPCSVCHSNGCD